MFRVILRHFGDEDEVQDDRENRPFLEFDVFTSAIVVSGNMEGGMLGRVVRISTSKKLSGEL